MTQAILTASSWLTEGIAGFLDMLNSIRKRRAEAASYRVTRRELNQLTDHELRDLGIGRSDIESIARGTFHDNTGRVRTKTNENLDGWV